MKRWMKDHQETIYTYFKEEAESESVEDALVELGENEYTEEDIRLIRINSSLKWETKPQHFLHDYFRNRQPRQVVWNGTCC